MEGDNSLPLVFCMGASHKSASIELREDLHLTDEQLSTILPKTREKFEFLELVALSTCNRFEIFGVIRRHGSVTEKLIDAYLDMQKIAEKVLHMDEQLIRNSIYLHTDDDAVRHIYRLAASLDSLVVGETQITGQFKDAVALAGRVHTIGPMLTRLAQEALATAKKIRNQTEIGKRHVSISHAAIDLTKRVFGDLSKHSFLLVGAGEMAAVAAKYIGSYKPTHIMVANRTKARAEELVAELGFGEVYALDDLYNLMCRADVVISSTAAAGYVIDTALVRRVQAMRRGRPLCIVDIALPRDIEPSAGKLDDVYLFDIDDLQQVVGANLEERKKAASQADGLIDTSVAVYRKWLSTIAIKPILAAFRGYLEDLFNRELEKTLAKEGLRSLASDQRAAIEAMLKAAGSKIAGDAARVINNPPESYFHEQLAECLDVLFAASRNAQTLPKTTNGNVADEGVKPAKGDNREFAG